MPGGLHHLHRHDGLRCHPAHRRHPGHRRAVSEATSTTARAANCADRDAARSSRSGLPTRPRRSSRRGGAGTRTGGPSAAGLRLSAKRTTLPTCPAGARHLSCCIQLARSPAGASMLDVAVPADVRRGGEPAHGHGMGLSTLQHVGLGLALEVHVPAEVGMPVDLLTRGDALLTSWALTWVSGPEAATAVRPGRVAQLRPC